MLVFVKVIETEKLVRKQPSSFFFGFKFNKRTEVKKFGKSEMTREKGQIEFTRKGKTG